MKIKDLPKNIQSLIQEAREAKKNAYNPYSQFAVGSALLTDCGKTYSGCNVENASYGATICAERTACLKAVSEGYQKFVAVAVVTDTTPASNPCGMCKQVLSEFCDPSATFYICNQTEAIVVSYSDFFTYQFTKSDLSK